MPGRFSFRPDWRRVGSPGEHDHRRALIIMVMAVGVEAAGLWLRTSRVAGNVVVRCRAGHLFTTIWLPGVSLKSLRFGWWRFQHCPVGEHWSLVTPVRETDLPDDELRLAREHKDLRIP
jgi:hypothetical protein